MNKAYQVIQVDESLYIIQEASVRCFLIVGQKKALLIDTSMSIQDVKGIVSAITDLPLMVANTHADADHTFCNRQFDEIYMHPSEYALYHRNVERNDRLMPLWDGDIIELGGFNVEVVANPGHTSGCITFFDPKHRRLIGGDSIQGEGSVLYMFGRSRDLLAAVHSLERIINRYGDKIDFIYPSHSECPIRQEKMGILLNALHKMLRGEATGEPDMALGVPVRLFDLGCTSVLYEKDKGFFEK